MTTAIVFIAVLAILVLAHEMGHFFVAKWSGMRVDEFGLGFPPRLFKIKRGGTVYSINLIPLGGFVKIHGESGEDIENPESFASKPIWKRFLVLVAGVVMNVVLAWALFSGGFMYGLPVAVENSGISGADIRDVQTQVTYVLPDSPADEAGMKLGDEVLAVGDTSVVDDAEARELIAQAEVGEEISIIVSRVGEAEPVEIVVAPTEIEEDFIAIGAQLTTTGLAKLPVHKAMLYGASLTYDMTVATAVGFWNLISRLFQGEGVGLGVAGPIGIAVMTGEVAELGIVYLINFAAILSINLAILNIIPFPALDGGRILFLVIELFRRKPATPKIEGAVHGIGFALLMLLVILITYKDIVNLFS